MSGAPRNSCQGPISSPRPLLPLPGQDGLRSSRPAPAPRRPPTHPTGRPQPSVTTTTRPAPPIPRQYCALHCPLPPAHSLGPLLAPYPRPACLAESYLGGAQRQPDPMGARARAGFPWGSPLDTETGLCPLCPSVSGEGEGTLEGRMGAVGSGTHCRAGSPGPGGAPPVLRGQASRRAGKPCHLSPRGTGSQHPIKLCPAPASPLPTSDRKRRQLQMEIGRRSEGRQALRFCGQKTRTQSKGSRKTLRGHQTRTPR